MKSTVTTMCLLALTVSQSAFSADDFQAYRLGHYDKAAPVLLSKAGKDAVADYYLGQMVLHGYGQLKNTPMALKYFKQSAEKGYLPAVQFMAKYTLFQEKNIENSIPWFKKAANSGDVEAQLFMAAAYRYGLGVKPNEDVATKYIIEAAKSGNAIAQFALSEHFIDSKHASNGKLGFIWLTKSAAANNPYAQTKLASLYLSGKLAPKDVVKGKEMLSELAAKNFAPAMVELGDLALSQNQYPEALEWYKKAIDFKDQSAYLKLTLAYLKEKTPIYDPKEAFLWTLKAAQNNVVGSKVELADLYKKGIGVEANSELAAQWAQQAAQEAKKPDPNKLLAKAALWLSNGTTDNLAQTALQMKGILVAWQNTSALKDNNDNQAPRMESITRHMLFKPNFALIKPNDVPITSYYDALVATAFDKGKKQWVYPSYPLNPDVEVLQIRNNSVVNRLNLPAPLIDANYFGDNELASVELIDRWTPDWQQQLNYMAVFQKLYFRAILGDAQSQFEIGQMFEYGLGVAQNFQAAIAFYQNAAEQQHLGAEYNLGMMYLNHPQDEKSDRLALDFLTDSAFKGNRNAQFVLAKVLEKGKMAPNGTQYIKPDPEQALSMLYLAAANNYGPAQYELAQHLTREHSKVLSKDEKAKQIALIHQLYSDAAKSGVMEALLPLAFYNAMDEDKTKQVEAFAVAKEQAELGDEKAALLLGMLYDRGIGVTQDPAKAIYWYEHAGDNPVSQFILGTYAAMGKGQAEDKERAAKLLEQSRVAKFSYADFNLGVLNQQEGKEFLNYLLAAYQLGNSQAGILLADYYLAKNEGADKINQAKQIYAGLAEKGDALAQLKLAYLLDKGLGVAPDPQAAVAWYTSAAGQGNAQAQYLLGQMYQLGGLNGPDYSEALHWYTKAANTLPQALIAVGFINETVDNNYANALKAYDKAASEGDVIGSYNLGLMYFYGKGGPVDYSKAKQLFTDAANKGLTEAMNQLATMYFDGLSVPQDIHQAVSWTKKSAELGNKDALYQLGLMSETGVGLKLDLPLALSYYQKAAEAGDEKATLALARLYRYGVGVPSDAQKSVSYYQKLIDRQNSYAQYQLGVLYLDGSAGSRLPDKGKQLLKLASDNGNSKARSLLQRMDAQTQAHSSYLEPVLMNYAVLTPGKSVEFMYFDALNEWNRGDEQLSRMMLQHLMTQHPNYLPAKLTFERINQS